MSLAFLFHYLMLNMFQMLIHPSSGAYDLFVDLFHGLYCSGTMCVGVTLWFGSGGVVSECRLKRGCRETNLMSLAFLFPYLMLNMFQMLIHPSSGACDLFVDLFHGLYCYGTMRVGVVSRCRLQPASRYHTTPAKPHCNTNTNRTRAIQPMK